MVDEIRRHPHARRVCRIHNGVDNRLFTPAANGDTPRSGSMLIGSAARLIPGKGIDQLVRAVAQLRDVKVRVEIAGDGPHRQSLVRFAEHLDVDNVVSFRGPIQMMPEFWRRCDLAVVPSDSLLESFSMATLEAMACGVPVVATKNGGIPEVLADGEGGSDRPPGDPAALAAAIRAYGPTPTCATAMRWPRERASRCFGIEATGRPVSPVVRRAADVMKQSLDFIVIGAQKSGTTTLFEYLRRHPELFLPSGKEAPFFSHDSEWNEGWSEYVRHYFGLAATPRAGAQ